MICYFLQSREISCFQNGNYGKFTERFPGSFEAKTPSFPGLGGASGATFYGKPGKARRAFFLLPQIVNAGRPGGSAFRKFSVIRGGVEARRLRVFEARDVRAPAPAPGKDQRRRAFRAFHRRRQVQNGRNVAGNTRRTGADYDLKSTAGRVFLADSFLSVIQAAQTKGKHRPARCGAARSLFARRGKGAAFAVLRGVPPKTPEPRGGGVIRSYSEPFFRRFVRSGTPGGFHFPPLVVRAGNEDFQERQVS